MCDAPPVPTPCDRPRYPAALIALTALLALGCESGDREAGADPVDARVMAPDAASESDAARADAGHDATVDAEPADGMPPDADPADGMPPDADPVDAGPQPDAAPPPELDDAVGVVHAWAAAGGEAYATAHAFPGGGALAVISAYGPVTLPTVDGPFEHPGPPADRVDVLLAWLDADGRITRLRLGWRHRGGVTLRSVWPTDGALVALAELDEGWQLGDALVVPADSPTRWLVRIEPDGGLHPLFGVSDDVQISSVARAGRGWVVAGRIGADLPASFLLTPDGVPVVLDPPPGELVYTWYAWLSPDAAPRIGRIGGTASNVIQAMAPTAAGELWLCIDAEGGRAGQTVVLDPGRPGETTFAIVSPDDDLASDLVYARMGPGGEVHAAWMHHSYVSGGPRRCAMQALDDGDLVSVSVHSTSRGPDPAWQWISATGELTRLPADAHELATTLARYTATGEPVWWRVHSPHATYEPDWLRADGALLRETLQLPRAALRAEPPDARPTLRTTYDLEDGRPTAIAGGGLERSLLLADGKLLTVIHPRDEARAVGTYTDAPFVCPQDPAVPFCVAVIGPAPPVDGVVRP